MHLLQKLYLVRKIHLLQKMHLVRKIHLLLAAQLSRKIRLLLKVQLSRKIRLLPVAQLPEKMHLSSIMLLLQERNLLITWILKWIRLTKLKKSVIPPDFLPVFLLKLQISTPAAKPDLFAMKLYFPVFRTRT